MLVSTDSYTIAAPPFGSGVLRATWKQVMPVLELSAAYEAVLASARRNGNCRFWLFDVSLQLASAGELTGWLRGMLAANVARSLGGAVYVALLVAPLARPQAAGFGLQELRYHAATADCYFAVYENAALALGWLRDQQELEAGDAGAHSFLGHWT